MKIVVIANTSWNVFNFRKELIAKLLEDEYEICVIAPEDDFSSRVEGMGCVFIPLRMEGRGMNPFHEIWCIWRLYKILKESQADVVLTYTIKPNIYASLVTSVLGINTVNNITGLGLAFASTNLLATFVRFLLRVSLKKSYRIFFQNESDMREFLVARIVTEEQVSLLPGSGINLKQFRYVRVKRSLDNKIVFLMVSRLVIEKGVCDYIAAARSLYKRYPQAEFRLIGGIKTKGKNAVPQALIEESAKDGCIVFKDFVDDIRPELKRCTCVVLPSYREGMARVLLEAAAMGRPVITYDVPGCGELVDDNMTGYLCERGDIDGLGNRMEKILNQDIKSIICMGIRGRRKMYRNFDVRIVVERYLELINALTAGEMGSERTGGIQ